jgi:hypothetical protein
MKKHYHHPANIFFLLHQSDDKQIPDKLNILFVRLLGQGLFMKHLCQNPNDKVYQDAHLWLTPNHSGFPDCLAGQTSCTTIDSNN